ncbi:hypothetical protein GCM10027440_14340 [Nocardiopsis coralliicola]
MGPQLPVGGQELYELRFVVRGGVGHLSLLGSVGADGARVGADRPILRPLTRGNGSERAALHIS